jgi:hypothetical protein
LLLSDASPLDAKQKAKMHRELHANPELGHMKRKPIKLKRDTARRLKERARMM